VISANPAGLIVFVLAVAKEPGSLSCAAWHLAQRAVAGSIGLPFDQVVTPGS
jgi:hypothetical protein